MGRVSNLKLDKAGAFPRGGHFVVHDAEYRVVVVKNPSPAHEHDVVHAHCIEQSLAGRGKDVADALADLARTVAEMISEEYLSSVPEYESNEDPLLSAAFERKTDEFEGCAVIRRGTLRVRLERTPVSSRRKNESGLRAEEISFLPLVA